MGRFDSMSIMEYVAHGAWNGSQEQVPVKGTEDSPLTIRFPVTVCPAASVFDAGLK